MNCLSERHFEKKVIYDILKQFVKDIMNNNVTFMGILCLVEYPSVLK